jgi:hypothetical protein
MRLVPLDSVNHNIIFPPSAPRGQVMANEARWTVLAVLLVCGCAARQPALPPGEDSQKLVTDIALRGQGLGPQAPDPPEIPDRPSDSVENFRRIVAFGQAVLYTLYTPFGFAKSLLEDLTGH